MLLGAASYLGLVVLLFTSPGDHLDLLILGTWNGLLLIVTALVIVDSVRKARAGKASELARDLFVVKLAAIPFFSINFIVLTSIGLFGSAMAAAAVGAGLPESDVARAGGGMLGIAALAIGLTYLAMLTTSTYGWATIAQLRRHGRIGPVLAALYRLMLLLFVVDVVAGIALFVHSRRGKAAQ